MPFPDIASVLDRRVQNLGEGRGLGVEAKIIEKKSMGKGILTGEETGPVWAADRNP